MRHCPRARAGRYYFHAYCDRYKNTVTVIQSNGRYFGGTNVGAWNQRSSANSQYQMLFSLTLNQALKQTSTLSNTIMYRSGSFGPFVSAHQQQQQQQQMLALHKKVGISSEGCTLECVRLVPYELVSNERCPLAVALASQWGYGSTYYGDLYMHTNLYGNCYTLGSHYEQPKGYSGYNAKVAFCGTASSSYQAFQANEMETYYYE